MLIFASPLREIKFMVKPTSGDYYQYAEYKAWRVKAYKSPS